MDVPCSGAGEVIAGREVNRPASRDAVRHGRHVTIQLAEVAVPRELFRKIPRLIDGLRLTPLPP